MTEVHDITTDSHPVGPSSLRLAVTHSVAAMPRLIATVRAIALDLTVVGAGGNPHPNRDAYLALAAERPSHFPGMGVRIIVANSVGEIPVRHSMRARDDAIVAPDISPNDLRIVVHAAIAGYYPVPRRIASTIATRLESPDCMTLSKRDLAILRHLANGHTMLTLAQQLGCSERHARRHVSALWNEMDVNNRAQGLVAAARRGFLEDSTQPRQAEMEQPTAH